MAERRPLVIGADGCPEELPLGDTLPGGGLSDDFLSAVFDIQPLETFIIPEFRQMAVFGGFENQGTLIIEGQLILEP
jgi:hypothetical protein